MKPVRHSLHRTPTLTQQARWDGQLQQAKRQGLSLRAIARKLGMFTRSRHVKYASWREISPNQTTQRHRSVEQGNEAMASIIDRRGRSQGDIFAFHLKWDIIAGLLSTLGLRVNHLLSVEQGPVG